jgi:hypothetical protein
MDLLNVAPSNTRALLKDRKEQKTVIFDNKGRTRRTNEVWQVPNSPSHSGAATFVSFKMYPHARSKPAANES